MAITIDGTAGTIAGVAVGGLPDGIVDGDMLAANAVSTGKILNATIASGDLASGALPIELVSTTTVTSTTDFIEITGLLDNTRYRVVIDGFATTDTAGYHLCLYFSEDNLSTTASCKVSRSFFYAGGGPYQFTNTSRFEFSHNDNKVGVCGNCEFNTSPSVSGKVNVMGNSSYESDNQGQGSGGSAHFGGYVNITNYINSIRLQYPGRYMAGNGATMFLYKINK
jgi:hypothetical protein